MNVSRKSWRLLVLALALCVWCFSLQTTAAAPAPNSQVKNPVESQPNVVSGIDHVVVVWFENREASSITAGTAPFFANFAATGVNFTNFYGVTHPSQPNYISVFSGSNQGVTTNDHFTFSASVDNLAKQLAAAGKSWRVYMQNYPSPCFDGDTFFDGSIDGPGVAGQYVRKHNPAISFESARLDPLECANIQPLANFDPTVNFAFVVPNMVNDMHDGTTAQGDAFLQAFAPLVTGSPDWAHTLFIVSFDEGTTSANGGGHIYTAANAPWLAPAIVSTTLNHFSLLRTIEEIFGLPFLGNAASATTMSELFPTAPTPTASPTATPVQSVSVSGNIGHCSNPIPGPVAGVTLALTGTLAGSTVSNAAGDYAFSGLPLGGDYVVTPSKAARSPGSDGITTVDVVATQRHYLDFVPLTGCRLTAGDVSGDSVVTTVDVIAIQRFYLGLSTGIAQTGQYLFTPSNRSYTAVISNQDNQDYDAVLFGDVSPPFVE